MGGAAHQLNESFLALEGIVIKNVHGLRLLRGTVRRKAPAKHRRWLAVRMEEQGGKCYWCKVPMFAAAEYDELDFPGPEITKGLATVDHLKPLGIGGRDRLSNIVAACSECNQARGCAIGPPPGLI